MPTIGMAGSTLMLMSWKEALYEAIKHGFQAFEIYGEFPQCICERVSEKERAEARQQIESSGISLAVHAPFTSLNIAALNPGIRRESVRQKKAAVDLCADLAGTAVILHNGEYVYSERLRDKAPEAFRMQWDLNLESLAEISEHAQNRGVDLCLENIGFEPEHMDRCVDDLLEIREQVPGLSLCLDIGHARLNEELEYAIAHMRPFTRHIHFTDNLGERDDHMEIGEGNFDYTPYLDYFRHFQGIITLEVVKIGKDPAPAVAGKKYVEKLLEI
ncbi:MAG: sugar phosphate isomerase/epimerase family protein [bacterium]